MEAFSPVPPQWTTSATHALEFCCPKCRGSAMEAERVWINRRSPVMTEDYRRKWQEFYQCQCGSVWWAWSSESPTVGFSQTREAADIVSGEMGLENLSPNLSPTLE